MPAAALATLGIGVRFRRDTKKRDTLDTLNGIIETGALRALAYLRAVEVAARPRRNALSFITEACAALIALRGDLYGLIGGESCSIPRRSASISWRQHIAGPKVSTGY